MFQKQATLQCQCGRCQLTLCDPRMRYRLECLCFDCRQRCLQFASKRPENNLAADFLNYERGVDDYYFANGFLIDDVSRDLIEMTKLRDDAFNTTAMSACCGTFLCGSHPVYENGSISVNADSGRVSAPDIIPNQVILFGCDCPPDKYQTRLKNNDVPTLFSVYDEAEHDEMIRFMSIVTTSLEEAYKLDGYVTFEQLCAEKTLKIDNSFFEESRSGK